MASKEPIFNRREETIVAGQAALEDSQFEQAANYFKAALRLGATSSDEEALIRCNLSQAYEKLGMYRDELDTVSRYDNFAIFARLSEQTQLSVLIRLGWSHSYNNDIPRAIALFNQAMRIARRLEDEEGIGASYFGLGRAYRWVSEIRIARDHYMSALEHFRQVGNWRELAECYLNIGNIDGREGDFRSALQSIRQAITIIGDRKEHELLGRAYQDLALIYDNLEIPTTKILGYWEKCINYLRLAGNSPSLAINYNNLACKLLAIGEWDRAEELAKSSIEILRGGMRLDGLAGALDTLAQLYLLRGRLEDADQLLEESLYIFSLLKNDKKTLHKENPFEVSTQITLGRSFLAKDQPEQALVHLHRSIDISERLGDRIFFSDSRLWLAEAYLEMGSIQEARETVCSVQSDLHNAPDMLAWGFMMRVLAKTEAAAGHFAAAHQSLNQSNSIYEIKGMVYDLAVNNVVLATMLEQQGAYQDAIRETEIGIKVLERLGATIDLRKARAYHDSLVARHTQTITTGPLAQVGKATLVKDSRSFLVPLDPIRQYSSLDLVSLLDGFVAHRIVQASVSRELLLHELASIVSSHALSRGAIIVELPQSESPIGRQLTDANIAASVGSDADQQAVALEMLSKLSPDEYKRRFVYEFTDNQQTNYLLHLIEPKSHRFLTGTVTLAPILSLVEQGLESLFFKSKNRRTKVFNPARVLADVELPGFICASRAMSRVIERIHKIRSSDVTVLITGESGTGKELIARAIHGGSSRRFNTFLPFNCSAAPRDMIESQLFGYRKGAFTGAVENNPGIIRGAEGGTLFLDEIGDLPLDLQPKLLRFLQEGEIHPIGESRPVIIDVRVLAATNSDLERVVAQGKFREDLFHRLNVIRIQVPPLRERREEIPALVNYYLKLYQQEAAKTEIQMSEEAVDLMVVYDWPGNVRQLCNEIRRIVAYTETGNIVTPDTLSSEIIRASKELAPETTLPTRAKEIRAPSGGTLAEAVEEIERQMIQEALRRSAGNVARAAKELGLSRKGLYLKMDRLDFKI